MILHAWHFIVRTPHPNPLFLKKGEVNFDYLPQRGGGPEKIKKGGGGSMVQGPVFLKVGAGAFPIYFF